MSEGDAAADPFPDLEDEDLLKVIPAKILEALQKDQVITPSTMSEVGMEMVPMTTEEREEKKEKIAKRKRDCEVCLHLPSKYCCPGCGIRTCSLNCVNDHKKESNCTGKRTCVYHSIPQMDERTLRDDYFFLKEVERAAGDSFLIRSSKSKKAQRNKKRTNNNKQNSNEPEQNETEQTPQPPKTSLPAALKKLVSEANHRGVTLRLMPRGMTRRKNNTTFYAYRAKQFYWKVEWIFDGHLPDSSNHVKVITNRLADSTILLDAVTKMIESFTIQTNSGDSAFTVSQRKLLREKCEHSISVPHTELSILLPVMNLNSTQNEYYRLDTSLSLMENLKNKTILEFPSLYVIHPNQLPSFHLKSDATLYNPLQS